MSLSSLSPFIYCDCMLFLNALDNFALLKLQFTRRRVGTSNRSGSANPESYAKRTYVKSAKNIRVSDRPPRKDPLRGPQLAPSTNSRVRSCSYQPERQVPNTPCPLQSIGRDKLCQFLLGNSQHTLIPKSSCR